MKPTTTSKYSNNVNKLPIKTSFQKNPPVVQFPALAPEDQAIQNKVEVQMYLHFQKLLVKSIHNNNKPSAYYKKKISRQKIIMETFNYLSYLRKNIDNYGGQHLKSYLFLIDFFNANDKLITNQHHVYENWSQPANGVAKLILSIFYAYFMLGFTYIRQRINLNLFLSYSWNHIVVLSFFGCHWFNDDDWKQLVQHADKFSNMRKLLMQGNNISTVNEGDIERFKSLKFILLNNNQLSEQSNKVLKRLQQKKNQSMKIQF